MYKLNIIGNVFLIFNICLFLIAHPIAAFLQLEPDFQGLGTCTHFSDHKEICSYS